MDHAWRAPSGLAIVLVAVLTACTGHPSPPGSSSASTKPNSPSSSTTSSAGGSTTLALIADFGNCGPGAARVADMIDAWGVAAVATAGDNNYEVDGCTPFVDSVGAYYGEYVKNPGGPRFFPALGNHDYDNRGAGLEAYREYFSYLSSAADPQQRWYDQGVGGIHLFVLDSQVEQPEIDAQKAWLKAALARSREDDPTTWNVVILHEPPFTSGRHEPDTAFRPAAGWDYRGWGADVVIAGHQHIFEDVVVDGFHYVTAGIATNGLSRGGCPPSLVSGSLFCSADPGALRIVAMPTRMTLEYREPGVNPDGDVVRRILLTRGSG